MTTHTFTFEELARADRLALERALINSAAPEPDVLNGQLYDGYNHDWLGQLPGKKFRKFFMKIDGANYGCNHTMQQDKEGFNGEWKPQLVGNKPKERGFFKVVRVSETGQTKFSLRYKHLTYFDYNVDLNHGDYFVKVIHDFVGLPNQNDYDLVLGKAYLCFASWLNVFASYFILKKSRTEQPL